MHLSPEIISAYSDNELSGDEREAARGHFAACRACRRELEVFEKLAAAVASVAVEPSADFESRVLTKLRTLPLPRRPLWRRWSWGFVLPSAGLAAAAAVLLTLQPEESRPLQFVSVGDDVVLADQAEFLEHLDLLEDLDLLEALGEEPG